MEGNIQEIHTMGEKLIFAISITYGFVMFVVGYMFGHKDADNENKH